MRLSKCQRLFAATLLCLAPLTSLAAPRAIPDGMNVVDLAQLADGETREFGTGEHKLTATRTGTNVTVTMAAPDDGESAVRTISCTEGDRCLVMVGDDDATHRMILIKTNDDDGEPLESHAMMNMVFAGPGDEGRPMTMVVASDEDGEGFNWATESSSEGDIVRVGLGDKVVLRCPEGDTHMTVRKDEAGVEYRCPKHGGLLAAVGGKDRRHQVFERRIIKTKRDAADDGK